MFALAAVLALRVPVGAQTALRPSDAGRSEDRLLERPALQGVVDASSTRRRTASTPASARA